MKKFVLFSKSMWSEAPRLRHQITNMLRSHGHQVEFFQKPLFPHQTESLQDLGRVDETLRTHQTRQLLHAQLRLHPALAYLNAAFEKQSIRRAARDVVAATDVVVNFNYDYFFLRDLFPKNKIVTVINDDFVAQAKFLQGEHVRWALGRTCQISDVVLTVSYPLMDQLSEWTSPVLFLPWADSPYIAPDLEAERNAVFLWAHIDRRIDFELLDAAAKARPNYAFHIVGPVAADVQASLDRLVSDNANVVAVPSKKLNELPLSSFFASIIPYKKHVKDIEAVTLSNKSFQLMSRGFPLVTHGMPHFYGSDAIFKSQNLTDFCSALDSAHNRFEALQSVISSLMTENQLDSRYRAFVDCLG